MKVLLNLVTIQNSAFDPNNKNKFPMGLLSVVEYTRERIKDIEWKVIVGELDIEDINEFKPDIVGFSVVSAFFSRAKDSISLIQKYYPDMPIVVGGIHITFYPEQLPAGNVIGIAGEGEKPFFELCKLFKNDSFKNENLLNIPSLIYRDGDEIIQNSRDNGYIDPEEIPVIKCYELCSFKKDLPIEFHIVTSRGCPYRCRFCSSSAFWKKIKYYPAEITVAQIKYIVDNYHPFLIHIFDDLMVANRKRLLEIHNLILKEGLQKQVAFACWATGNIFNDEMAKILKEMNVQWLDFAIESGSPKIYKFLKGTWNTPAKTEAAIRCAYKHGFSIGTAIILGAPDETVEDMQISYDLVKSLPVSGGFVSVLKAYPGTQLWKETVERGIVSNNMSDWLDIERNDLLSPKAKYLGKATTIEETFEYYKKFKKLFKQKRKKAHIRRFFQMIKKPGFLFKRIINGVRKKIVLIKAKD